MLVLSSTRQTCNAGQMIQPVNVYVRLLVFLGLAFFGLPNTAKAMRPAGPRVEQVLNAHRIVFLGDSITYGGEYVEFVEAYLRMVYPSFSGELIDLGLPSETVSGLTEPGHAGGAFPRPELRERLGRVLDKTKPDLIFACYGMNDGIYYPFSEARFARFREGIQHLREEAPRAHAKVIFITPPTFDPAPLKGKTLGAGHAEYRQPFKKYNDVLDRYSKWLLQQRSEGWEVIDVHGPMNRFIAEHRREDAQFLLAADGVHANTQGHWVIAREVLRYLGAPNALTSSDDASVLLGLHPKGAEILKLIQQRQRSTKDAWLTETGHVRPGMNRGKPLAEARHESDEITATLHVLINK